MDTAQQADPVEPLVRRHTGAGHALESGPVWLTVWPDGSVLPAQGWKLHLSARAADYLRLLETVLPALLREGCPFKLARSLPVLRELNEGLSAPAAVGKAVTIYPDQNRVRELGLHLAGLLRGRPGPRVLSDRQVTPGAPVYYRYGPFRSGWESGPDGQLVSLLHGPGGEQFGADAALGYRQPAWAIDPFTGTAGESGATSSPGEGGKTGCAGPGPSTGLLLGGRYLITGGVHQSARGNVYSAVDQRDGRNVVVKQARALVAEYGDGNDTRLRLRNERRVLQALDGVPGVPVFLDHFRHADDEFLVTSHCGPRTLMEEVLTAGPYPPGTDGRRGLERLARDLAGILGAVHRRGVIMRDLSPKNVVTDGDTVAIVDFGIAALDGLHLPGATPGYAPARQQRDEPPRVADDYFALGMTLLFAATMLDPVAGGTDLELPRLRALQTIRSRYGPAPRGVLRTVTGLLSADCDRAGTAWRQLADGQPPARTQASMALPAPPRVTLQITAEVTAGLLEDLLGQADGILRGGPDGRPAHDASIYSGSAGVGLELLQHLDQPRVAGTVADLAAFSAAAAQRVRLPPGLFAGHTGVTVFLREAARHGISVAGLPTPELEPEAVPAGRDLIAGAAGAGLGHLHLYRVTGDPAHLELARRCAGRLTAEPELGPPLDIGPGSGRSAREQALDTSSGCAHGLAGTTGFLLAFAAQTGDEPAVADAARHASALAQRAGLLIAQSGDPAAPGLAVSWCRGLAGIGQTLLQAGLVLNDEPLVRLARDAADACLAYLPKMSMLGRCCGAAGVGTFLIDLAAGTGDPAYWAAADQVAAHLLLRGWGPPGHPRFVDEAAYGGRGASWALGLSGLLTFFRRLAHRGGPDSMPFGPPAPDQASA